MKRKRIKKGDKANRKALLILGILTLKNLAVKLMLIKSDQNKGSPCCCHDRQSCMRLFPLEPNRFPSARDIFRLEATATCDITVTEILRA